MTLSKTSARLTPQAAPATEETSPTATPTPPARVVAAAALTEAAPPSAQAQRLTGTNEARAPHDPRQVVGGRAPRGNLLELLIAARETPATPRVAATFEAAAAARVEAARSTWAPSGVELQMMGRRRYEDYDDAFAQREAQAKAEAAKLEEEAKGLEKPGWFASSEARDAYAAQQESLSSRAQALEDEAKLYRSARDTGFFGGRADSAAAEAAASAIDAERAAAELQSVQSEAASDPEPPRGGWLFGSAEHAEWSKRDAERQRRLAQAQPTQGANATPTLKGPPKRPDVTAPSKPTSRVPNRREVPVNADGTVSVWRAVGKGELEGTRREDARFFAPPGYKDVAQDYARRKGGYTGKMVEYRIPEDEYYRSFQKHEYRLDATKAEIELPKGHDVEWSRYRKVVHDEHQAQAPDSGRPSSSSSGRKPAYEEMPPDANIWDKDVAAKMDPMEWQRRRADQDREEAARAKEQAWAEEQAQKWRDARRS